MCINVSTNYNKIIRPPEIILKERNKQNEIINIFLGNFSLLCNQNNFTIIDQVRFLTFLHFVIITICDVTIFLWVLIQVDCIITWTFFILY